MATEVEKVFLRHPQWQDDDVAPSVPRPQRVRGGTAKWTWMRLQRAVALPLNPKPVEAQRHPGRNWSPEHARPSAQWFHRVSLAQPHKEEAEWARGVHCRSSTWS